MATGQGEMALNWKREDLDYTSGRNFFTVGMGRHWNRLSSNAVNASSLQAFKARLDRTFEQPDLEGGIPAYSSGKKLAHLKGLFHSIPFYDSIL